MRVPRRVRAFHGMGMPGQGSAVQCTRSRLGLVVGPPLLREVDAVGGGPENARE
jgi:hypothetical protein